MLDHIVIFMIKYMHSAFINTNIKSISSDFYFKKNNTEEKEIPTDNWCGWEFSALG